MKIENDRDRDVFLHSDWYGTVCWPSLAKRIFHNIWYHVNSKTGGVGWNWGLLRNWLSTGQLVKNNCTVYCLFYLFFPLSQPMSFTIFL